VSYLGYQRYFVTMCTRASGPIFVASYHSSSNKLGFDSLNNMKQSWQDGYHDRLLRDDEQTLEVAQGTRFENWLRLWHFVHDGLRRAKALRHIDEICVDSHFFLPTSSFRLQPSHPVCNLRRRTL
jgi:hypothetical protein